MNRGELVEKVARGICCKSVCTLSGGGVTGHAVCQARTFHNDARTAIAIVVEEAAERQRVVLAFTKRAFGERNALPIERARRLLEEALELAQACGVSQAQAFALTDYTFSRPAGEPHQEIGGIGLCLLAAAESLGLSAEVETQREIARVLAKSLEHWKTKHDAKAAAGVADFVSPQVTP